MRIITVICVIIFLFLSGCQPQDVQVTITYDRNPTNTYPYTTYGDVAKIYYTIGTNSYVKEVYNHRSDKYVSDANGTRSTVEDAYYKADSKNPNWKF